MARSRFTPTTRFMWDNQVYVVRQLLLDGSILIENQSFGGQQQVPPSRLEQAWVSGALRFELSGPNTRPIGAITSTIATGYTFNDFQTLPPKYQKEAWRRYQLLLPLLKELAVTSTNLETSSGLNQLVAHYLESLSNPPPISSDQATATPFGIASAPNPPIQTPVAAFRRTRAPFGEALSRASLYRWFYAFKKSGWDIRSLVPQAYRQGGPGQHRLGTELEAIIAQVIEESASDPHRTYRSIADIYLAVVAKVDELNQADSNKATSSGSETSMPIILPGRSTVYRRIKEYKGKAGPGEEAGPVGLEAVLRRKASRSEQRSRQGILSGPQTTCLLERVEIDHTSLDLFVVDEEDRLPIGRPNLTVAIDAYSAYPLGFYVGFEPPSYRSVMNCLLHAILPKDNIQEHYQLTQPWLAYGLPHTLVVDRGNEFMGQNLANACAQLGIELLPAPPRTPWFKGRIERYFGTTNTGLIHTLPGTTFSNVIKRGDYNPTTQACISLTALRQLLHAFFVDFYAQRWHSGIEDVPAARWRATISNELPSALPSLPHSVEDVRLLLLPGDTQLIGARGIEFKTLIYQNAALMRWYSRLANLAEEKRRAQIKYDPGDLSSIYVCDPTGQGGWLRVEAVDQVYTKNLSVWKHRVIRRYVLNKQKQVNILELAQAKAHIQQIVEQEFRLSRPAGKQTSTRKRAARFLEIGTGPVAANPEVGSAKMVLSKFVEASNNDEQALPQAAPVVSKAPLLNQTDAQNKKTDPATGKEKKARSSTRSKTQSPSPSPDTLVGNQPTTSEPELKGREQTPPASLTKQKEKGQRKEIEEDEILPSGWGGDYGLPSTIRRPYS